MDKQRVSFISSPSTAALSHRHSVCSGTSVDKYRALEIA